MSAANDGNIVTGPPAPFRAASDTTGGGQVAEVNNVPRRNRIDLQTPEEAIIRQAISAVEAAGAHPLLTDAVMLLQKAQDKFAEFVEMPDRQYRHPSLQDVGHGMRQQ